MPWHLPGRASLSGCFPPRGSPRGSTETPSWGRAPPSCISSSRSPFPRASPSSSPPGAWVLVPGGRRRPQVVQSRLEPLLPDPDPDGLGEVQRRVSLLPRNDRVPEASEPLERLVADARVHEELAPFGVQARRLDRRLERAARVDEGRDHLRDRRDDPATAGRAEREVRLAALEGQHGTMLTSARLPGAIEFGLPGSGSN